MIQDRKEGRGPLPCLSAFPSVAPGELREIQGLLISRAPGLFAGSLRRILGVLRFSKAARRVGPGSALRFGRGDTAAKAGPPKAELKSGLILPVLLRHAVSFGVTPGELRETRGLLVSREPDPLAQRIRKNLNALRYSKALCE